MIYVSNIDIILAGIRILYLLFVNLTLFFSGKACKVIVYKILDYRDRLISCDQSLNSPFGSSSKAKDLNACNIYIFFPRTAYSTQLLSNSNKSQTKRVIMFSIGKKKLQTGPTYIVNFILTSYD